ncbi:hypothetical protein J5N97_025902 [Dioscorea zingiberensis]|uniref:Uncharacterized protein n=1 Tax=Dioscorea zingiberensis TaxID=325984 RepID=A0A9D5C2G6_9LILI|nr:hypothetical protein J5N97_025902 [Dioscorea zingiberensis]
MLFLGSLGDLPLAAGSLAIAFANITGYSILSGLSLGAEPLCSQASGASRPDLLSLSLLRSSLLLLSTSLPLSFLWLNSSKILTFFNQDPEIASMAQSYLHFSLPDLFSFSLINPIRVYLRSQSITRPLTLSAAISALVHLPANLIASSLNLRFPASPPPPPPPTSPCSSFSSPTPTAFKPFIPASANALPGGAR